MADTIKRRIFAYWVNTNGVPVPDYIKFCIQTWYENIPGLEVIIINHDNLYDWLPNYIDKNVFTSLMPAHQSDIVSFFVLYYHGGVFMDCDTLVTKDIFNEIEKLERDKVYFFGTPNTNQIEISTIISIDKYNEDLLYVIKRQADLMEYLSNFYESRYLFEHLFWSTFGNNVINRLLKDEQYKGSFVILDRIKTGYVLQGTVENEDWFNPVSNSGVKENFINFYFKENEIKLEDVVEKIKFGAICLHNSWTPKVYKQMSLQQIINDDLLISRLIRHALGSKFLEDL